MTAKTWFLKPISHQMTQANFKEYFPFVCATVLLLNQRSSNLYLIVKIWKCQTRNKHFFFLIQELSRLIIFKVNIDFIKIMRTFKNDCEMKRHDVNVNAMANVWFDVELLVATEFISELLSKLMWHNFWWWRTETFPRTSISASLIGFLQTAGEKKSFVQRWNLI